MGVLLRGHSGIATGSRFCSTGIAIVAFAAACGGQTELTRTAPEDASALDAGRDATLRDTSVSDTAVSCEPLPDGRLLLAKGLRAPYFVAAPTAPDDPVVVQDHEQDQMYYRFIDPHTCKLRASFKPGDEMAPIALGEWIARRDRSAVSLFHLATGNQLRPITRAVPIAIHADTEWLYIVSAFVEYGWGAESNESVQTAFIERVPRSDLTRVQSPELVATLDLSVLTRWNTVSVFSTPSQLLFRFAYHQLDVSGPFALIQLELSTLTQRMLLVESAYYPALVPTGDDVLVQLGKELRLYPAGGSPHLLREDFDQLDMRGLVASDVIAASWNKKLLALPLHGGAARELASDILSADVVSTSNGRVYWTTLADELWSMPP